MFDMSDILNISLYKVKRLMLWNILHAPFTYMMWNELSVCRSYILILEDVNIFGETKSYTVSENSVQQNTWQKISSLTSCKARNFKHIWFYLCIQRNWLKWHIYFLDPFLLSQIHIVREKENIFTEKKRLK